MTWFEHTDPKLVLEEYLLGPQPMKRMGGYWGDGYSVHCTGDEACMMREQDRRFAGKFNTPDAHGVTVAQKLFDLFPDRMSGWAKTEIDSLRHQVRDLTARLDESRREVSIERNKVLDMNTKVHEAVTQRMVWNMRWEATDRELGRVMAKLKALKESRVDGMPIMQVSEDSGETYLLPGHDVSDAYESFGDQVSIDFFIAYPSEQLCVDEGCPHHGTQHVCREGANIHGIGPDVGGGPNPHYVAPEKAGEGA